MVDIAEMVSVRVLTVAAPAASTEVCSDWVGQGEACSWASAGTDYEPIGPADPPLTFNPGDGSFTQQVRVKTLDDFSGESTEVVLVELGDESGAAVRQGYRVAGGKILDDEATASITDVTAADAAEGDPVVFRVTLDRAPAADVTLDYTSGPDDRVGAHQATQAGSCGDVGGDFLGATGQVVIAASLQQATFEVATCEDVLVERDETFWVGLSRGGGEVVVAAGAGAHGTIRNDDIPVISVSPATAAGTEGQPGPLAFTVSLTVGGQPAQLTETVTVAYEIGGSGTETAAAPGEPDADYGVTLDTAALGSTLQGTLAFTPGAPGTLPVTEHVFEVELLADYLLEDPETFVLRLSDGDPSDSSMLDEVAATGTIVDDPPPVLFVDGFTGPEGTTQSFTVTLSGARGGETVNVDYAITGDEIVGNGDTATAPGHPTKPADFEPVPASGPLTGTVTLEPGTTCHTSCTVEVSLLHDTVIEGPEELRLTLTNPSGAVLSGSDPNNDVAEIYGVGIIENVDPPVLSVDGFTGPEGSTQQFTVTLSGARGETVTVDYEISGGTGIGEATAPGSPDPDFEPVPASGPLTGTVTLESGTPCHTSCTVDVSLLADYVPDEGPETLRLTLTNPSGAVLSGSDPNNIVAVIDATGTIEDVDPPVLSVNDFTGPEGTVRSFIVTLSGARGGEAVTVDYVVSGGTGIGEASAPGSRYPDFEPVPASDPLGGVLMFGSGVVGQPDVVERTVGVSLLHDTLIEVDEELRLVLSRPSRAVLFDRDPNNSTDEPYGVGIIENVDNPPRITVDNVAQDEGLTLEFTVTVCNRRAGDTVTVDYRTANRSAAAGPDYDAVSGTLTFNDSSPPAIADPTTVCGANAAAAQSHSVAVPTLADAVAEVAETFHLVLSENPNPSLPLNATLDKGIGVGTINNVNAASVVVRDPAPAEEGETLTFTIAVEDSTTGGEPTINTPVKVSYATADRTANAGADYTSLPRTEITFNTGSETHDVTVQTLTDSDDENDETFALILSDVSPHAGIGDAQGTGTIIDVPPPAIRIEDARATEADGQIDFRVHLVDPDDHQTAATTDKVVRVFATAVSGTATAIFVPGPLTGEWDYTHRQDYVEIPARQSEATFSIPVIDDGIDEGPETFTVELSQPSNASIDRGIAVGTIEPECVDIHTDDAQNRPPEITLYDAEVIEDSQAFQIDASFSRVPCEEVTLSWAYVDGTATPLMDHGGFGSLVSFPLVIGAIDWRRGIISASVYADDLHEDDETVNFELSWGPYMPSHYQGIAPATAQLTIIDDDPPPFLRISDASADEGEVLTFEVTLDTASGLPANVEYRTVPNSSATPGTDYTPVSQWAPLVIDPGDTSETFDVATIGPDGDDEGAETFLVELRAPPPGGAPMNAIIADGGAVGTILDAGLPTLRVLDASAAEGGDLLFPVELSPPATGPITVAYATVERPQGHGAATEGADYTPADPNAPPLTFAPGEVLHHVAVSILGDLEDEPDETFLLELSNAQGAVLADPSAVGTIEGNVDCVDISVPGQSPPGMTVSAVPASEDAGVITFTLTLDQPLCQAIRPLFDNVIGSVTALEGLDFQRVVRYVNLAAYSRELSVDVPLIDDDIDELDETVGGQFTNVFGFRVGAAQGIGTIVDNDGALLSILPDRYASEGDVLSFTVRLDRPADRTVTVDYATAAGTAIAGVDYRSAGGTLVIAPGERTATAVVQTIHDGLDEEDESLLLLLSNPMVAQLAPGAETTTGWIQDNDDFPVARISDASADEGGTLTFAVTLDRPSGRRVNVSYETRNGTAVAGSDFVGIPASGVAIEPGDTRATITVQAQTDSEEEGDERFFVDLTGGSFVELDDLTGVGVIRDVSERRVSVSDAVVGEGGVLSFVVGFDGPPSSRDVTVGYSTVAVSAEAGADYSDAVESVPGVLRILAGRTSAVVGVATVQDSLDEDLEQLRLVLSDPVGAVLAGGEAVGTIIDDDPEPLLSVDDPEATENGDGTPVVFTLRLSEVSGRVVSVSYSTVDSTAKAGDDYVAVSNGRAAISAGAQTAPVEVALVNDDVAEDVERFLLELSGPSNARFGDSVGAATVLDDDAAPQVLIDDAAATYEAAGASVSFAVRLSRADPGAAVTVDFATEDATALAGDDYTHTSDTLTFAAGQTAMTVWVDLVDDDVAEETETFGLRLSNPSSNATVGDDDSAVATVLDDDALPKLSVFDAPAATEGTTATFAVELSRASARAVTVGYAAVADPFGGDAAAIAGQDFEAVTGTLTIPARATSATVAVPLPDDALDEHTETFWLRLADPTDATVANGTGIGTIDDDDPLPQLNIANSGATEGETIRFEVTLEPVSGRTVTVPWTTAVSSTGDPASPTDDFAAGSGTLTFASGTTSVYIDIDTVDDELSEPDETFQVQLGQPIDATVDDGVAVGAIVDDDSLPRLSIAGTELFETDSPATFVVTLSSLSGQAVTVDYATHAVTATARDDYGTPEGEATGTLVISAGLATGEISVYVADDGVPEGTETFWITLSNAQNAVIAEGSGLAVGTILDDDVARIAVGDADAYEADGTIEFPVTLSAASAHPVTARYTTFDGSATQPDDYTAATGTLTIPAHTTTATIAVTLTDDTFTEEPESFIVRLSAPADAEIEDAEAVGVILDDDNLPVISIEDIFGREDDGVLYWSVNLSRPSNREVTVDYTTAAGHSCPPTPAFELVSGTLVFEPGSTTAAFELPLVDNSVSCAPYWRIEEVVATLSNLTNAQLGVLSSASAHIHDDESRPYASFLFRSWDRVLQVGEGDGTFFFTIQLWRTSEDDITFDYRVDETATLQSYIASGWRDDYLNRPQATAASDFPALGGSVTIPAGERYATVTVPILDDGIVEETETFLIALLNNSNVDYILQALRVEIIDDDARSLAVEGIEVHESAGTAQFRVTLDGGGGQPVTVQYATADGTATAPDDYAHTVGELTFSDGATSAFVQVPLVDDEVTEASETFELRLSNPVGADIGRGTATATIRDDNLPVITLASASEVSEDQDRNVSFLCFDLTASDAGGAPISADYQYLAAPWLGERAAEPGADYLDWTADGPLTTTFGGPGGETSTRICARVVNDTIPERDEMFILWLSNPVNAVLGNSLGWATILDSDRPIVSIADVGASEADDAVVFTVQLHEPGLDPARLRYTTLVRTSEGEAAARPGDDYIETTGTLNIAAGETTATISVPIIGDSIDEELDETFLLELSEPEGLAFSKSTAVGTITDDDPGWVIDDRSVWEDSGSMVFTATRDHTGTNAVTVNYTVTGASAAGGADCAAGVDYITPSGTPSGSVTLQPSDTQAHITVTICDDDVTEGSESLLIELAGVPGRRLTGTGTIVDNDSGGCIDPQNGSPAKQLRFTATEREWENLANLRFKPYIESGDYCVGVQLQIAYRTADGTATAPADYTSVSGSVEFDASANPNPIFVYVVNDNLVELDETLRFFVRWGDDMPAAWSDLPEVETQALILNDD